MTEPMETRRDPYLNCNFRVEIDGIGQAGFSGAAIPDSMVDVIEYREGCYPAGTVRVLPGNLRCGTIVLKWGAIRNTGLTDWWARTLRGAVERRDGAIVLLDQEQNEVLRWRFFRAWPSACRTAGLDARSGAVLIETMELAHEGIIKEVRPGSLRPHGGRRGGP